MFNGTRDVRSTIDRKQHDWSQLAEAPETNTLLADQKSYTNPKVQELLKSVHICQSYRKNKSGTLFMAHGVCVALRRLNTRATVPRFIVFLLALG